MSVMACAAFTLVGCGGEKKSGDEAEDEDGKAATEQTGSAQSGAKGSAGSAQTSKKAVQKPADLHMVADNEIAPGMQLNFANVGISSNPAGEMLKNNKKLENLYFTKKIGMIETSAFQGCTNLKNVYADSEVTVFGDYSFQGCTSLKTLDVTTYTIGEHAFEGCTSLQMVKLANLPQMDIRTKAFAGCTSLKTVLLGLEEDKIVEDAFQGCTALEEVAVPYNRKENMYAIISASKNVKKLFILTPAYYAYPAKTAAKAFNKAQCEVYVPDALLNDFKKNSAWAEFKDIKPLSASGYYDAKGELK